MLQCALLQLETQTTAMASGLGLGLQSDLLCGMETATRPVMHKRISMTSLDIGGYLFEIFTDDIQLKYLCKY